MSRIFITGSADGLGLLAANNLIANGHQVVLHARNAERALQLKQKAQGAEAILMADLSDIEETKTMASEINNLGNFDAIIHNAGVYQVPPQQIFAVNTLAPYILTCLIKLPARLIYLSSGMHLQGKPNLEHFTLTTSHINYSDSKLHVVMLSKAVARKCPGIFSNSVDPGWVPTKMGGSGAPDDLAKGYETQVWLATSDDENVKVTGQYFHHQKIRSNNPFADDTDLQDTLLSRCEELTGIKFPGDTHV